MPALFLAIAALAAQAAPTPKPEPMVEKTRKNIRVLKGVPDRRFYPLMNFVAVSLGVHCDHCHVKQGDWVWESDDKPAKQKAREMMKMTMALNQGHLADFSQQKVTCFTCHRGATVPARQPELPLAKSGHEPGPTAPPPAPEAPRPPEAILDRYLAAVGGREAIAATSSLELRGTRAASQGRAFPIDITWAAPDRMLVVVQAPGQEIRQGFAGGKGWLKRGNAAEAATPTETEDLRSAAMLSAPLKISQPWPKMTSGGTAQVSGREADVLIHQRDPATVVRYHFDRETGLLVRQITTRETVLSPIPEQVDFEDYRDVGGLKLPFTVRISNIDTWDSSTRTFTEIRAGVPVDEKTFAAPSP